MLWNSHSWGSSGFSRQSNISTWHRLVTVLLLTGDWTRNSQRILQPALSLIPLVLSTLSAKYLCLRCHYKGEMSWCSSIPGFQIQHKMWISAWLMIYGLESCKAVKVPKIYRKNISGHISHHNHDHSIEHYSIISLMNNETMLSWAFREKKIVVTYKATEQPTN